MNNLLHCIQCGNSFTRKQSDVARGRTKFCSTKCSQVYRSGERNANWKGGAFINENGYMRIKVNGRYKYEHRHFMEEHLGRKLNTREHVHHINGNKLDNRLENLQLMSSKDHAKLHQELAPSRKCWVCVELGKEVRHYSKGMCKPHYEKFMYYQRNKWFG